MHSMDTSTFQRPWHSFYPPETSPFIDLFQVSSIPCILQQSSEKWSQNIAYSLVLANGLQASFTYEQVQQYSDFFAIYLKEHCHLQKGDRVALHMPNCLAYPVAAFGVLKAGGVIVNTNPLYTPTELVHQFVDSGAKVLVSIDMFADKLEDVLPQTAIEKVVLTSLVDFFSPLKKSVLKAILKYVYRKIPSYDVEADDFSWAIRHGESLQKSLQKNVKDYWSVLTSDDLAALQYTGGTTGVSKGAMLTHGNLLSNLFQISEMGKKKIRLGQECILTALPLYHVFAFQVNLLTFFYLGGTSVLIPNPRPLSSLRKAFEKHKITWISGVNTLFNGLLQEPWFVKKNLTHLTVSIAGGAALHKSVAEKWLKATGTPVVEGYGLTEASPVVAFNPIGGQTKEESVGIPMPNTDVIFLGEDNQPVAFGNPGELAVKGPQVMKGYWMKPEETAKVFFEEWLLTGDIGVMDNDGYIRIVDRKKDMILVSGFNVYPNEVEDCITQMPEVKECAVIGIPHELSGEIVKAFVVIQKDLHLTEAQVIAHCREHLTGYKVPKRIEFRDELPKSPVGKILRKNLKNG